MGRATPFRWPAPLPSARDQHAGAAAAALVMTIPFAIFAGAFVRLSLLGATLPRRSFAAGDVSR
jgi:hypothetical protein